MKDIQMKKEGTSHLLTQGNSELGRLLSIDDAVEHALQTWPKYQGGDLNLTDILFLANTNREDCNLQLKINL